MRGLKKKLSSCVKGFYILFLGARIVCVYSAGATLRAEDPSELVKVSALAILLQISIRLLYYVVYLKKSFFFLVDCSSVSVFFYLSPGAFDAGS